MYYLISLFLSGRRFPSSFLYRPSPLCILPICLGSLALTLIVFNIALSLLIKKIKQIFSF